MQTGQEALRFIRWMAAHPNMQHRLCDPDCEAGPEECLELIESLEAEGFYEMIYVLLVKNCADAVLGPAFHRVLVEAACRDWERAGMQEMCRSIKAGIRAQMGADSEGETAGD